jgi:hypothetical protein
MPQPFPFPTDGYIGQPPTNFYPAADSERQVILHGTPGLKSLCTLTDCTEVRGLREFNSYLYAVARRGSSSVLWRIDSAGGFAELGNFSTSASGPVWMTNNLAQLLIVDGVSGYAYTPATGIFAQITDPNFATWGAAAADYQDSFGLFVQPDSIYWYLSALQDFTSFDGSRYSKEALTDNIQGILSNQLQVYLGGFKGTEVWQNTGGDNTSPATMTFQRVPGGLIKYGWASPNAAAIFDNRVAWLTDQGQVVLVSSMAPSIISTDWIGRQVHGDGVLPGMSTYDDAITFSYVDHEHTFFWLTFPTGNLTIAYDAKTQTWHQRSSLMDDGVNFGRHRANCYALAWGKHWVGDYSKGKVMEMSQDYFDDDGDPMPAILYSKEIDNGIDPLPFPNLMLLMDMGTGPDIGRDPQVMLEKSNDGGKNWVSCGWRSMGLIGEYTRRAIWLRQGQDCRRQYRLTITDPVKRTILGVDGSKG